MTWVWITIDDVRWRRIVHIRFLLAAALCRSGGTTLRITHLGVIVSTKVMGNAKVRQLVSSMCINQNIFWLDITMTNSVPVQVFEGADDVTQTATGKCRWYDE